MSAILNNQIQPASETRLSSLALTSMLSHWLTAKPFVPSLYKCDTTRMVGRPVNSTAIYTSLLISLKTIPPLYIIEYSSSTTLTAYISLMPYIYLHSVHLINPALIPKYPPNIPSQPTFH